jgi:hypothetical protein
MLCLGFFGEFVWAEEGQVTWRPPWPLALLLWGYVLTKQVQFTKNQSGQFNFFWKFWKKWKKLSDKSENRAINQKNRSVYRFSFRICFLNKPDKKIDKSRKPIDKLEKCSVFSFSHKFWKLNFVSKIDQFSGFRKKRETYFWCHMDIVICDRPRCYGVHIITVIWNLSRHQRVALSTY